MSQLLFFFLTRLSGYVDWARECEAAGRVKALAGGASRKNMERDWGVIIYKGYTRLDGG